MSIIAFGQNGQAKLAWAFNVALHAHDMSITVKVPKGAEAALENLVGVEVRNGWARFNRYDDLAKLVALANLDSYRQRYGEDAGEYHKGYLTATSDETTDEEKLAWSVLSRYRNNIYREALNGLGAVALDALNKAMHAIAEAKLYAYVEM